MLYAHLSVLLKTGIFKQTKCQTTNLVGNSNYADILYLDFHKTFY